MTRSGRSVWLLVIFLGLVGGGYLVIRSLLEPVSPPSDFAPPPPVVFIDIPEGTSLRQLAARLEREKLIKNQWVFIGLAKMRMADRRIRVGEYAVHAGMRPDEILAEFLSGRIVLHPITIPEGYTIAQMADLFGQKGLADPAEFIRLAHDPDFVGSLKLETVSLEGYLFPSTYRFARHTKPKEILREMVRNLWTVFTPELQQRAQVIHMTPHQILTLASIIEKETGVVTEREFISAVFHNRLKKRIALASDPTVIYGLQNFDGNIRKKDLDSRSPYNTYRVRGLPPGPIANPGLDSIKAALYPAPTKYLYFVSRNDGSHQFSSSLVEHNRAVDKYQRRPAKRQRSAAEPEGFLLERPA